MSRAAYLTLAWTLLSAVCLTAGCKASGNFFKTDRSRLLSPDKVVKTPSRSPINPILPNVGLVDQSQELVPNASLPIVEDLYPIESDYVIGPADIIDIYILDLFQEGAQTPIRREVSKAGYIDLPLVADRIKASGLTPDQLKEAVCRAYSPNILRDPVVSIIMAAAQQSSCSVLGAVYRPGQYMINRPDTRLLEVLAMAGGIVQPGIKYIYIIRPSEEIKRSIEQAKAEPEPQGQPLELPKPVVPDRQAQPEVTAPSPDQQAQPEETAPPPSKEGADDVDKAMRELMEALPSVLGSLAQEAYLAEAATGLPVSEEKKGTWRYQNGRWVSETPDVSADYDKKTQEQSLPSPGPGPAGQEDPFGWKRADKSHLARVIAINYQLLEAGEPKMNIVVRSQDILQVPYLKQGEFYIAGEVLRPGPYSLTGRQVTVKQALAAAGNLGPLAWPENSILVRRIGDYQEQIIPLDIEAIFRNDSPDLFLRPDDQIWVGTDVRAIFYAVMRNAFRMTYGFGFIYDRNFADPLYATPRSNRFTRL